MCRKLNPPQNESKMNPKVCKFIFFTRNKWKLVFRKKTILHVGYEFFILKEVRHFHKDIPDSGISFLVIFLWLACLNTPFVPSSNTRAINIFLLTGSLLNYLNRDILPANNSPCIKSSWLQIWNLNILLLAFWNSNHLVIVQHHDHNAPVVDLHVVENDFFHPRTFPGGVRIEVYTYKCAECPRPDYKVYFWVLLFYFFDIYLSCLLTRWLSHCCES